MEWLSVKDRLPDQTQQSEVVFYSKPFEWWSGMYTPKGHVGHKKGVFQYHQHWGDDEYHTIEGVTHWIPLPSPPRAPQGNNHEL